jgi:hypothetical protein
LQVAAVVVQTQVELQVVQHTTELAAVVPAVLEQVQ